MPTASYFMNPIAMRMFSAAATQKVKNQKKEKKRVIDTESVTNSSEESTQPISTEPAPKVVNFYTPKRGTFFKLGYNENHIPNQCGYEKDKK